MLFLLMTLLLCNSFEAGANITKLVNPNENVTFNCTYNVEADKMRWSFLQADHDTWDVIFDAPNQPNPAVKCDVEQKYCTIEVSDANVNKAGRYRFEHGINGQPLEIACRYELIVGELHCQSNIRESGLLIGENDCPVKPETFTRSCAFSYFGYYNSSLNFIWRKSFSVQSLFKSLKGNVIKSDKGRKLSSIEDSVQVSNDMDNAIFECLLEGESQIHPCKLAKISVQYLKIKSEDKLKLHSKKLQKVNCSVLGNQSLECRYHWEVQSGNIKFEIHEQNLTENHLIMPGLYTCQARCQFFTGESCQLFGRSFDLLPNGLDEESRSDFKNGYFIAFLISMSLNFYFLLVGVIFLLTRIQKKKKIIQKNHKDKSYPGPNSPDVERDHLTVATADQNKDMEQ